MHPILFDLGFFALHTYGLLLAIGFLAGLFFLRFEAKRQGLDPNLMSDLLIWILIGGIVGARILYCILHPEMLANPLEIFAIWKGGQVYYGGFLGAILAGYFFSRKHKLDVLNLADLVLPPAMLGQAIGRWGCFMAGCCYGGPADADFPLGVAFPADPDSLIPKPFQNADMANPVCWLHPTQLYMSANALLLCLILWIVLRRRRCRGLVSAAFLILYPITRGVIELFRGDTMERVYFGPLSTSQWLGLPLLLLGLFLLITCARRPLGRPERKG